jgi:hypothetical protein
MAVNNLNIPGVGIQPSLIDAKGDLLVGTADDVIDRLGVTGTTGAVLTADAGETTGLKWAAAGSVGGLVHINTTSFSGVASVSAPADTFTNTYANYKVLIYLATSSDSRGIRFRIRAAGSDLTTSTYRFVAYYANSAANSFNALDASSSGTSGALGYGGVRGSLIEFDIANPKIADYTHLRSKSTFSDATNMYALDSGTVVNNTTSYDSFTIFPEANNFTGTVQVFGYKD